MHITPFLHLLRCLGFLIFINLFSCIFIDTSFATGIDLSYSPVKYELDGNKGDSLTRTATFYNNTDKTLTIDTGKSDFISNGTSGVPQFVKKSELAYPDQQLASWITISTPSFIIGPHSSHDISFTINIPQDAPPGGHYWAVFFKYRWVNSATGVGVWVNVDYGIIILLNIWGVVTMNGGVNAPWITISWPGGAIKEDNASTINTCILVDIVNWSFNSSCIVDIPKIFDVWVRTLSNISSSDYESWGLFAIDFNIPFTNSGTTHIKPEGEITLIDENWKQLLWIGKESIKNDLGAIIWEKVTDYLPFNDSDGNVLPWTTRVFNPIWNGFPYKSYDDQGNQIIKYWSPWEYYAKKLTEKNWYIQFWQEVRSIEKHQTITAKIDVSYIGKDGKWVSSKIIRTFPISYTADTIGINPFVALIILIVFIIFCIWLIRRCFFKRTYKYPALRILLHYLWKNTYTEVTPNKIVLLFIKNESQENLKNLITDIDKLLYEKNKYSVENIIGKLANRKDFFPANKGDTLRTWVIGVRKAAERHLKN